MRAASQSQADLYAQLDRTRPGAQALEVFRDGGQGAAGSVANSEGQSELCRRCILYIMRRTQLYLDDDLWSALHARAQSLGTSISELVRIAVRERYVGKLDERRRAMEAIVGIRKDRPEFRHSQAYVRSLRRGSRIERLGDE